MAGLRPGTGTERKAREREQRVDKAAIMVAAQARERRAEEEYATALDTLKGATEKAERLKRQALACRTVADEAEAAYEATLPKTPAPKPLDRLFLDTMAGLNA